MRHVFVCTNTRPVGGKPSCGARGSAAICAALQRAVAARTGLCEQIAVTESGCLGPCFDGPNAVVYPEGVWYAGVTEDDVGDIVGEHLAAGTPVERLRYSWPDDD